MLLHTSKYQQICKIWNYVILFHMFAALHDGIFLIFTFVQKHGSASYYQMRKMCIGDFCESKHISVTHIETDLCCENTHMWTRSTGV